MLRTPIWQRPKSVVGIDPGRTGGIAEISEDGTPRVWPMPPSEERGIDLRATREIIRELTPGSVAALEWNTGKPNEVPDFAFRFGLQTGQLDALFYVLGFQTKRISSNLWTGRLGLPGKTHHGAIEQRAALWDQLYPDHSAMIRGPRGGVHDGLLDALLIAHWQRGVEANPFGLKGAKRPPRAFGQKSGFAHG